MEIDNERIAASVSRQRAIDRKARFAPIIVDGPVIIRS